MRNLIARIEAATGPDREIDRDIAEAVNWAARAPLHEAALRLLAESERRGGVVAPYFSASLDAAVSLVPADHMLQLIGVNDAWDVRINPTWDHGDRAIPQFFGRSCTPALALCAAALRARLAMQEASDAPG